MEKRKISLIEILVVIAMLGVFGAFFLTNIMSVAGGSGHGGDITRDTNNLKSLCNAYTTGLSADKPSPKATGHRFWLALFVGDIAGTKDGLKIEDAYARPGDADMLRCSKDQVGKDKHEMIKEFQEMLDAKKSGWDLLKNDELYTSYAGPRSSSYFAQGKVVGATGSRNGIGFFETGFAIVRGNGSAEFKEYTKIGEEYPDEWADADEFEEPLWNSTLLKTVLNLSTAE